MNKELKYGGYTASPNDHDNLEGDLAVAMNLIPENGAIRPVLPPSEVFTLPDGFTVMCIHHTSAYKHYILKDDDGGLWWVDDADEHHAIHGDGSTPEGPMYDFGEADIYKVEPIGNTLTVLTSTGIHYILWKNGAYHYLGDHIPELDLQFKLIHEETVKSKKRRVLVLEGVPTPEHMWSRVLSNEDGMKMMKTIIMASLNDTKDKVSRKRLFSFPFFVRYAFRLYDGSLAMHSAPMLMVPSMDIPQVDMGWTPIYIQGREAIRFSDNGDGLMTTDIRAIYEAYSLHYHALDSTQLDDIRRWEDIISSVDVYISPLFYTYNQAATDDEIEVTRDYEAERPGPKNKELRKQISDNGNFYLLNSIQLKNIPTFSPGNTIKPYYDIDNDNIVVHELMTDDYQTHDSLIPGEKTNSYGFNSRINISSLSRRLFEGFNPACMFYKINDGDFMNPPHSIATTHTVVVEEGGKEIILRSKTGNAFYGSDGNVLWYYYPNSNAKRVYVNMGGDIKMLQLTPHALLNGAYYYSESEEGQASQDIVNIPEPSQPDDCIIGMPNILYTSEVNNPFFFPVSGINSVGAGEILGICSAVKALSQGQFGQFPLYAFTSEGVWALQTTSSGGYSAVQPVTRDVCTDADSITQLDDAVLFTTARGIMLISGSTSQCISETIDDDGSPARGLKAITDKLAPLLGLSVDVLPFRDFLEDCRMIYDYRGQRVIVYNPACAYAYIYSLESNKWGMMASDILYSVKTYPDAMAVTRDGHLVNYSDPVEVLQGSALYGTQLLVTRPLTLDQPDVLKTVRAILQRGLFRKRQGRVQSVLYGSRDLMQPWHLVMSSGDENLRGFSGTPYKWFRVALLLRLAPDESVTSCSIQFEPRYNNRLR